MNVQIELLQLWANKIIIFHIRLLKNSFAINYLKKSKLIDTYQGSYIELSINFGLLKLFIRILNETLFFLLSMS